jgi:hypothetical protein
VQSSRHNTEAVRGTLRDKLDRETQLGIDEAVRITREVADALGESNDMTAEEVGRFVGEYFSTSWLGGAEASQYLNGLYRNFMAMPGATADVMRSTPTTVTARFNRPGTRKYGPIVASDDIRWARGTYLSWLTWMPLLSLRMENGLSAAEIGAADAELYGPTWSARTPWQLFRG